MGKRDRRMTVAEMLSDAISRCGKTQREIAEELGYDNPNIITMFKQGHTKLPLKIVGQFARAVGIDPAYFLRVVLLEYMPDTLEAVEQVSGGLVLSDTERALIREYRSMTHERDLPACVVAASVAIVPASNLPPHR